MFGGESVKLYKKRIGEYKKLVQGQYVNDISVQNTMRQCQNVIIGQKRARTSYFEFLYEQSKFIKKRWWSLQGMVLLILWLLLRDSESVEYMGRITGILVEVFVILIIPEIWKNRRHLAVEIERTSFYSLRQICAARMLLFAIVDLMMVMIFFIVTFHTVPISICDMVINFLIPFNVSSCICFRLLYSKWMESEYIAVIVSMVWIILWSVIVTHNALYHIIVDPIWIGLIILSFGYLIFLIRKAQMNCEKVWKNQINGINA